MSSIALAATLSSVLAVPIVKTNTIANRQAPGWWQVQNNCDFTIFYSSVNEQVTVVPDGYVEPGTTTSGAFAGDLDGLSVKLCSDAAGCANPYQFETTVDMETGQIFYDLSAVNGDPFIGGPRSIYPSDGSGPTFSCASGDDSACAFTSPTVGPVGASSLSAVIIAQFC